MEFVADNDNLVSFSAWGCYSIHQKGLIFLGLFVVAHYSPDFE
jgi:hypothetical protein